MEWRNYSSHVKNSKTHERAVKRHAAQRMQLAAVQKAQEADLQQRREATATVSALRDIHIAPVPGPSAHRIQSMAETELWEQIDMDPHSVGFDVGIGPSQQHDEMQRLWNAGTMGNDTGSSIIGPDGTTALDEDDNDEFLAEIMQNAGKPT